MQTPHYSIIYLDPRIDAILSSRPSLRDDSFVNEGGMWGKIIGCAWQKTSLKGRQYIKMKYSHILTTHLKPFYATAHMSKKIPGSWVIYASRRDFPLHWRSFGLGEMDPFEMMPPMEFIKKTYTQQIEAT